MKSKSKMPPVKFVRRTTSGKYEHGHIMLGETRDKDKYVRTSVVKTYDEAANAQHFEPAVEHKHGANGMTYYEGLHSRNQGHHTKEAR